MNRSIQLGVVGLVCLLVLNASAVTAASITGGVRDDATILPISGATVRLEQGGQIRYTTTTNSSGVYTINNVTPGTYNLVALKGNYCNWISSRVITGTMTGQNIAMTPGPRITGGVRNSVTSSPISGATVSLKQGGVSRYSMTTPTSGVYDFPHVTPGTYDLVVEKSNFATSTISKTLQCGTDLTGQNVALVPLASITGGVRDLWTVLPIQGAYVVLRLDGEVVHSMNTPSSGVYSFQNVNPGTYDLFVQHAGHSDVHINVTLNPGQNLTDQNVTMTPTTSAITGGIRNEVTNAPLEGVYVVLRQNGQAIHSMNTPASGVYSFFGVQPGTYDLLAFLGGYQDYGRLQVLSGGVYYTGQNIAMRPLSAVSGGVRDLWTDLPIQGAYVVLRQSGQVLHSMNTPASGVYSFQGVIPGIYDLFVQQIGYSDVHIDITLNPGQSLTGQNVAMTPTSSAITGGIRNEVTEAPLGSVYVVLRQNDQVIHSMNTPASGVYSFYGVQPGTYDLLAFLDGYQDFGRVQVLASGIYYTGQNIAMKPLAAISGGVRDLWTDLPIQGAYVVLRQDGQVLHSMNTPASGAYGFQDVIPGTYDLFVQQAGYSDVHLNATLNPGQSLTGQNVAMTPTSSAITGGVRNEVTEAPLGGVYVALRQNGQVVHSMNTPASGVFSFFDVQPGTYDLLAFLDGYQDFGRSQVFAGGVLYSGQNIELNPLASVSGGVRDGVSDLALDDVWVVLRQNGAVLHEMHTQSDGVYLFDDVDPGTYDLLAFLGGYHYEGQSLVLSGGQTVTGRNIEMFKVASLSGGVRDASNNNQAMMDVTVRLNRNGVTKYETSSSAIGAYLFPSVAPGTYERIAIKSGYSMNVAQLALGPDEHRTGANIAMERTPPPPVLDNVTAIRNPGSQTVRVNYHLAYSRPMYVSLLLSTDGGATFPHPCGYLSGAFGQNILEGNLQITWDYGRDFPSLVGSNLVLKVLAVGLDHSTEAVSPQFSLGLVELGVDLVVYEEDISFDDSPESVAVSAVIRNIGNQAANNVLVRFKAGSSTLGINGLPQIGQTIIQQLPAGSSVSASAIWVPSSESQSVLVSVDPDDHIYEANGEYNNTVLRNYGLGGPTISSVTAQWDGDPDPGTIGSFITGVQANNMISVNVAGSDILEVQLASSSGHILGTDTNGADGWGITVDMGGISYPSTLYVTARDARGLTGWKVMQLNGMALPSWLSVSDAVVNFINFSSGRYTCHLEYPGAAISFLSQIPGNVEWLSNYENILNMRMEALASYGVNGDASFSGSGSLSGAILKAPGYSQNIDLDMNVSASINREFQLQQIAAGVDARLPISIPEIHREWWFFPSGIPIMVSVGLGGDATVYMNADAVMDPEIRFLEGTHVGPGINVHLVITGTVSAVFGLASARFVGEPTLDMSIDLQYTSEQGTSSSWCGSFIVPYSATFSICWHTYSYSGVYPSSGTPIYFGDCGRGRPLGVEALYASRGGFVTPTLPDIASAPALRMDKNRAGGAMVWIADLDPVDGSRNPEVYSVFRGERDWGPPIAVTNNDQFESDPALAYTPNGVPLVVWTRNSLPREHDAELAEVFDNQDIFCAIWDTTTSSWSTPSDISRDESIKLGDGQSSITIGGDGTGICAWVRTLDSDLATRSDWEIYYAVWIDSTVWSSPGPITNDNAADWSPQVVANDDGTALAVWLRDEDADSQTTTDLQVVYSVWNGSGWTQHASLSAGGNEKSSPSVAVDPQGGFMVAWAETQVYPDSTKWDSIEFVRSDSAAQSWSASQDAYGSDRFILEPQIFVGSASGKPVAMLSWKGYDGYDGDVFASVMDLTNTTPSWTTPVSVYPDSLTDWMLTSDLDHFGNAYFVSVKTDILGEGIRGYRYDKMNGVRIQAKGVTPDLDLIDDLNIGGVPVMADLSFDPGCAAFMSSGSNEAFARVGEVVDLHSIVRNTGLLLSETTLVRLYAGHPDSGGVDLGTDTTVAAIDASGSESIMIPVTAVPGIYDLYLFVDPDNTVEEMNEDNNLIRATLFVTADLRTNALTISDDNPNVGDMIEVVANYSNTGSVPGDSCTVRFYDGEPSRGNAVVLAEFPTGIPGPGESSSTSISWTVTAGSHMINVVLDPDNLLREADESDNGGAYALEIFPDLEFVQPGPVFSGGDCSGMTVDVNLRNSGGSDAAGFWVRFFDNDPLLAGAVIDSISISVTCFDSTWVDSLAIGEIALLRGEWIGPSPGEYDIFAVADPEKTITDCCRDNNAQAGTAVVRGCVDLTASENDIHFQYVRGEVGADSIHLVCEVHNLGNRDAANVIVHYYAGEPGLGDFMASMSIPLVPARGSASGFARWEVPSSGIPTAPISAVVDAWYVIDETDEENNIAARFMPTNVNGEDIPKVFSVGQNYPNPFNPNTYIPFDLPAHCDVELTIYDMRGRSLRHLVHTMLNPGSYSILWDGRDDRGQLAASGVYFYEVKAASNTEKRKLLLVR